MKTFFLHLVIFVITVSILGSCKQEPVELEIIPLSLKRVDYNGNELIIDGYYSFEYTTNENITYVQIYFLYENGIISGLTNNVINKEDVSSFEEKTLNGTLYSENKDNITNWGVFQINNDVIKFEKWMFPAPPVMRYQPYISEGKILNDTTFHITESYTIDYTGEKNGISERDETYHFKKFSPKPDSTNTFIN